MTSSAPAPKEPPRARAAPPPELAHAALRLRAVHACFAAALLVAAVLFAFAPALSAEFTNWDDQKTLLENPHVRALGADELRWMFTTTFMGPYQPLSWLSLAVDHQWNGMDPRVFHASNLAWHACAAFALFLVAWRLFGTLPGEPLAYATRFAAALAAAALFALHPLRCESVCWITERRDVLSAPFLYLALWAWLGWTSSRARSAYVLALVCFGLALLAKATVVVAPVWMLVLDVWPLGRWRSLGARKVLREIAPFAALAALVSIVAILGQRENAALLSFEQYGALPRAVVALGAPAFYLAKTLLPVGLSPLYELPMPELVLAPAYLATAAASVVLTGVLWVFRKRAPAAWWTWLACLAAIAPVSGALQAGTQLAADRYTYLAFAPFALLCGAALARGAGARTATRAAAACVALAACTALAVATRAQSRVWHDSLALWRHVVALEPESHTGHENLGDALVALGHAATDAETAGRRYAEARDEFTRSIALRPFPRRYFNLGAAEKNLADTVSDPQRRVELLTSADANMRRGAELARANDIAIKPDSQFVHAVILRELDRAADALPLARAAAAGMPGHLPARLLLGDLHGKLGHTQEALAELETAVRMAPGSALVLFQFAKGLVASGDFARGRAAGARALELATAGARTSASDERLRAQIATWLAGIPR